jgi:hypothetical protein
MIRLAYSDAKCWLKRFSSVEVNLTVNYRPLTPSTMNGDTPEPERPTMTDKFVFRHGSGERTRLCGLPCGQILVDIRLGDGVNSLSDLDHNRSRSKKNRKN